LIFISMKGFIIIGYPGIGKSSCGGKLNCIDLESESFFLNGHRVEDWYIVYCTIAMRLANQGFFVFVSSHKVVRDYLTSMPLMPNVEKIIIFCPGKQYKNEWIRRLKERYNKTGLDKDYRALDHVEQAFDSDIDELVNYGLPVYQLDYSSEYDLMDYVYKAFINESD